MAVRNTSPKDYLRLSHDFESGSWVVERLSAEGAETLWPKAGDRLGFGRALPLARHAATREGLPLLVRRGAASGLWLRSGQMAAWSENGESPGEPLSAEPCPWCGAEPAERQDHRGYWLACQTLDCPVRPRLQPAPTPFEARLLWNLRPIAAAPQTPPPPAPALALARVPQVALLPNYPTGGQSALAFELPDGSFALESGEKIDAALLKRLPSVRVAGVAELRALMLQKS